MVAGFMLCQNQYLWDCLWRVHVDITSVGAGLVYVRETDWWDHRQLALLWCKPYSKADCHRPSSDSTRILTFLWLTMHGTCKHPERAEKERQFLPKSDTATSVASVQGWGEVKATGKDIQVQMDQAWAHAPLFYGQVSICECLVVSFPAFILCKSIPQI